MTSQNSNSKVSLKKISNLILNEQAEDIKAYTAGHLNENHLYKPIPLKAHRPWKTALRQRDPDSDKNDPELISVFNKKEYQLSFSNYSSTYFLTQRKKSPLTASTHSTSSLSKIGVELNKLKLPYLVKNDNTAKKSMRPLSHLVQSEQLNTSETVTAPQAELNLAMTDKEIAMNFLNGPFNGGSREEKFKNLINFEKNVLHKEDISTTNVLHSTVGISSLEKRLEQELTKLNENNSAFGSKFQFDVYRLDVFNSVFDQIISESKQFGPLLSRIKMEYDDYLFHLLRNQQQAKQKRNNSINELSEARIEYSKQCARINTLDNEIESLANMIDDLGQSSKELEEKVQSEIEFDNKINAILKEQSRKSLSESSAGSSEKEEAEKRLSEQLEKNRIQIVTKLDELNQLNQTLKKDYVPISVINNLSQSIKEVEGETNKLNQQNLFLAKEEIEAENELKQLLLEHDRTEFADENISFLFKLIKNLDVFLSNNSYSLQDKRKSQLLENIFEKSVENELEKRSSQADSETSLSVKHSYDDYFS